MQHSHHAGPHDLYPEAACSSKAPWQNGYSYLNSKYHVIDLSARLPSQTSIVPKKHQTIRERQHSHFSRTQCFQGHDRSHDGRTNFRIPMKGQLCQRVLFFLLDRRAILNTIPSFWTSASSFVNHRAREVRQHVRLVLRTTRLVRRRTRCSKSEPISREYYSVIVERVSDVAV